MECVPTTVGNTHSFFGNIVGVNTQKYLDAVFDLFPQYNKTAKHINCNNLIFVQKNKEGK